MAYGHAERNLAVIRRLEAETRLLLMSLNQPDAEPPAWPQERATGTAAEDAISAGGATTIEVSDDHDAG
jgi:hypothetical protein